jgi:hypothetical protein
MQVSGAPRCNSIIHVLFIAVGRCEVDSEACIAAMTIFSMSVGIRDLVNDNAIVNFNLDNQSLKWLSVMWGLHQCMPGLVFAGYDATSRCMLPFEAIYLLFGCHSQNLWCMQPV